MSSGSAAGQTVNLTGLVAASPLGFMAAAGLLRVCAQDHRQAVALSWTDSHAVLHGLDRNNLVELLAEHMRGRADAPEFNFEVSDGRGARAPVSHLRQIRPEDFRHAARQLGGNERAMGFLAGYGTDAVVNDKGFVARTRLDFTSGQQQFMVAVRQLAKLLDPAAKRPAHPLRTRIERALFGGAYEDQHSFGWDPASLMAHAHQPAAPSDSVTPGQPMAVWLAVEALPLHPVTPLTNLRARTAGFVGGQVYQWAQWQVPLNLQEVTLLRQRAPQSLAQIPGVTGLWAAGVTTVGKYGFLMPGARI